MQIINGKTELHEQLDEWRQQGEHIALVATMGNLHAGHISLVDLAREHAERVVVTVYVNPTQFGADEDFDDYPRTLERDTMRLKKIGADILYAPSDESIYPFGHECATVVSVPGLTENFCGALRPGHFDGVTTVVARLFACVQPDVAIFGQKDFQQQLVIRYMAEDLGLPIRIITASTVREKDGLAMSSRNQYLNEDERKIAPKFHSVLESLGDELSSGNREFESLEASGTAKLAAAGFDVEYLAIRRAENLAIPNRDCDELVVLAAVRLGKARLIDNVVVTI
ncbi:MAG: pantoate--beta-alanine ligase [Woeseiaceae bacterium]|nr:pantoate--beta-alanine ligase [Woeseiaceae bacterium]